MGLFGPPDVEKLKTKGDITGLVKALAHSSARVRIGAAGALGNVGDDRALVPLVNALGDSDFDVVKCATWALEKIGDARIVPALIASLTRPSAASRLEDEFGAAVADPRFLEILGTILEQEDAVRECAAEVLGRLGDRRAVEPLIGFLRFPRRGVEQEAIIALGQLGDPRAVSALMSLLGEKDVDDEILGAAIAKIGAPAVPALLAALGRKNGDVRRAAAYILGDIGDQRAIKPLMKLMSDEDESVRLAAVRGIRQIDPGTDGAGSSTTRSRASGSRPRTKTKAPIEPLITALGDENRYVRRNASVVLSKIGAAAVEPLISALRNPEPKVRVAAAEALGMVRDVQAVMPLTVLLGDKEEEVAQSAAESLGQIGSPDAIEPLLETLRSRSLELRKVAATGLVDLFETGSLDQAQKAKILAARSKITRPHSDRSQRSSHYDGYDRCSRHEDEEPRSHTDSGIGVDFPI